MKRYKIVFLDWNGTLSTSKFWGHLEKSNEDDKRLFQKIDGMLFGELNHLIKPWMRGEIKSENVIKELSSKIRIDYQKIFNEFVRGCEEMEYVTDKCIEFINKIKISGTRVIIATDNMDSFIRWTVPALELKSVFDDILDSYTLKALKNDFDEKGNSLFFDKFMRVNKINKGESILIDDSEDKEGRIQAYGIDYFQVEVKTGILPALEQILCDTSFKTSV